MAGLVNLPKSKWSLTDEQVILLGDFLDIETALPQLLGLTKTPTLQWLDITSFKVAASVDSPANVMMLGFPDVVNPGQFITGGLTDNTFRQNTADATADFDVSASLWGTKKASQWYAVLAIPGASAPAFALKMMPGLRVKSQASQTISTGTLTTPATGIGYGFTTDEFVGGSIYFISGASKGLVRTITANNNDNTTGGTITYSGAALTVASGDWFIILPPTNFRYLGYIFNDSGGNIRQFFQDGDMMWIPLETVTLVDGVAKFALNMCSPLSNKVYGSLSITFSPDGGNHIGYVYGRGGTTIPVAKLAASAILLPGPAASLFPVYNICTFLYSGGTTLLPDTLYISGYSLR